MYLDRIQFIETGQDGNKWLLNDFTFGKINLLVGQNATGKSIIEIRDLMLRSFWFCFTHNRMHPALVMI